MTMLKCTATKRGGSIELGEHEFKYTLRRCTNGE